MTYRRITLPLYLIKEQRRVGGTGVYTALMTDLSETCKTIANEVNRGAMAGTMGYAGSRNVQGEDQKALDVLTNDIFLYMTEQAGNWAGMASEELEHVYPRGRRKGATCFCSIPSTVRAMSMSTSRWAPFFRSSVFPKAPIHRARRRFCNRA